MADGNASESLKSKLKLNRNAKVLLLIGGLFTFANGLSGTFVNVYLWKSNQDFVRIGLFNLFHYLFIPITFVVGGWLTKRKNGTLSLRIGILFHAVFYLTILLLGSSAYRYVIILGILLGTAVGFYWLASHTLSFDLTSRFNRDTFNSFNGMVGSLSGMLAPLLSGYTIVAFSNSTGYRIIFGISLGIFVGIILVSLLLKTETSDSVFHLLKVVKESNAAWKYTMLAEVLFGVRNGILMFLINLLVYIVTKSEASIGKLALLASVLSIGVFYVLERILKPRYRIPFFSTGAIMMFVSVSFLAFNISYMTLFIFIILNTIFAPLFAVPFDSATFNCIEKEKHSDLRIEYIVFREIILNTGRLMGTLLFILVVKTWKDPDILRILLLVIGAFQLPILLFVKKLDFDVNVIQENKP